MQIGRTAELCREQVAVQPCQHCGSTAAIINLNAVEAPTVRRICCGADAWWLSDAARAWFDMHGVDVRAEAACHG